MVPPRYDLRSRWSLSAPIEQVWAVVADPRMSWPEWWPQCTADAVAADPAVGDGLVGRTARVAFRAWLGYTLHLEVRPTRVQAPHFIEFDAGGDLSGIGRVALVPAAGERTTMYIQWRVRPTRRWMLLLSPLARPAFAAAHAGVMRRGERGLRRTLGNQRG